MRQRQITARQKLFPGFDGLAKRGFTTSAKIISLRMLPHEQSERDVWQARIKHFMPAGSALWTGRIIAGGGFARIAKAHWDNGCLAWVIELLPR